MDTSLITRSCGCGSGSVGELSSRSMFPREMLPRLRIGQDVGTNRKGSRLCVFLHTCECDSVSTFVSTTDLFVTICLRSFCE